MGGLWAPEWEGERVGGRKEKTDYLEHVILDTVRTIPLELFGKVAGTCQR